ncbi:MAG: hypothetical protein NTX13_11475 [Acidobacteria bacterium]|nr:hypothetical protein [Acidobacteriota bacterium]
MKPAVRIQVHDSSSLRERLIELAGLLQPEVCIECGTHRGLGSTRILVEIAAACRIPRIYTMEISRKLFEESRRNLAIFPQVECLWGLSVDKAESIEFIQSDPLLLERGQDPDIYIDFLPDPVSGYLRELEGALGGDPSLSPPDRLLHTWVPSFAHRRPLFCLDSAGGVGLLEYQTVRRLMGELPFIVWIDDVNHVKHYRSLLHLQSDPAASHVSLNWDEGWGVALVNANSK